MPTPVPTPATPPFRDLLREGEAAPPFALREAPADPVPLARRSWTDRWNRLSTVHQRLIIVGLATVIAGGILMVPDAHSTEVVRVEQPASQPERESNTTVKPTPVILEAPLPSWYVTLGPVAKNTHITAENSLKLFRAQPGKPLPPNAVTNLDSVLGRYAVRPLDGNTIITPADFSDRPSPEAERREIPVYDQLGVVVHTFEKQPSGDWISVKVDDRRRPNRPVSATPKVDVPANSVPVAAPYTVVGK